VVYRTRVGRVVTGWMLFLSWSTTLKHRRCQVLGMVGRKTDAEKCVLIDEMTETKPE